MLLSLSCKYSRISMPTGASAGNSIKPSASATSPNSFAEQSIPNDSTPRNFDFLILKSPGNTAPMTEAGIFKPARTFAAPHTICNGSASPTLTLQTRNLSASGCCSVSNTSPTTTPLNCAATGSTESTSKPAIVICATSSSVLSSGLT